MRTPCLLLSVVAAWLLTGCSASVRTPAAAGCAPDPTAMPTPQAVNAARLPVPTPANLQTATFALG